MLIRFSFLALTLCIAIAPLRVLAAEPKAASDASAKRATTTKAPAKKAPRKSAAQQKKEAAHEKWLAQLKERDVEPWPENETDDEHAAQLKKSREMVDEVKSLYPGSE